MQGCLSGAGQRRIQKMLRQCADFMSLLGVRTGHNAGCKMREFVLEPRLGTARMGFREFGGGGWPEQPSGSDATQAVRSFRLSPLCCTTRELGSI
jgi:hypothetical protein